MPHAPSRKAPVRSVPVLIVGGGGSGLTASILLSDLGVGSLLVERHPSTSPYPKAHILNGRTMEIMAAHGLAEDIYAEGAPPESSAAMVWLTSLGGDEPYDRKVLHRTDAYGGGALAARYAEVCAQRHGNLGQRWLEPLLRRHAEQRNPGGLLFHHELVGFEQDDDGVTAEIFDRDARIAFTVRAKYLIGADGGKTVGGLLGVPMLGTPTFLQWINLHVRSDFSGLMAHDDAVVNRICSLSQDGQLQHCGVVPMGPNKWGRHSEEWTLMFARPPGALAERETDDAVVELVRRTLKLPPEHRMEVCSINRWPVEGTVAERFGVGRVFLVGDAAHRHPPSGALGLNTGIQDVHNLAWKLAAVLGGAGPALLDSYQAERRPVAERVVDRAIYSLFNQVAMTAGTGVMAGASAQWNRRQLLALFADTPEGEARRRLLAEYFDTNRITTEHLGLEIGYSYPDSGCVLDDGTPAPAADPLGLSYTQCARPGHRMPHAWLRRGSDRVGTHQLIEPGAFLLLTAGGDRRWADAAAGVAGRLGVELLTYRVGQGQDLEDPDGTWAGLRGHDAGGAVLVRPDGFVAARGHRLTGPDPAGWLDHALRVALGLPVDPPGAPDDQR